MSMYDTGILMTSGFSIAAAKPADLKYIANTIQDRDNYVTNNLAYEGMLVYVKADEKTYQYRKTGWEEFGFNLEKFQSNIYDDLDSDSTTLALSAKQGKVLDTKITAHSNNTTVHVTTDEKNTWNAKASTNLATQTANGLMSNTDKKKLDSISVDDINDATKITQDETHRFVTDEQIAAWNAKLDSVPLATQGSAGLMSGSDKLKLDSIDEVNGNYTHPDTHPATIIEQDATHRFVTDEQITKWNATSTNLATQTSNGLMSNTDKKKLDGIEEGANNYIHPDTPEIRHVTDEQIAAWNSLIEEVNNIKEKLKTAVFFANQQSDTTE